MAQPAHAFPDAHENPWPAQGEWTWEDYLRLPDDGNRYEIIEGTLYVSAAPIYDHQFSVFELAAELRGFVKPRSLTVVFPLNARGEYEEWKRFGPEDDLRSRLLKGFETPVSGLFLPRRFRRT